MHASYEDSGMDMAKWLDRSSSLQLAAACSEFEAR